ncbi:MAG: DUF3987 domain-containing protein [Leptospirillia bacterium]
MSTAAIMEQTTMVDRALDLAGRGFHVFPVVPDRKTPAIKGWQEAATTDPDRIRQMWRDRPHANIGIYTGRLGDDDQALLVIDVDNKEGKHGDGVLLDLMEQDLCVSPTMEQRTPSGGRHLIYIVDRAVKQGVDVLGPGLDIRSAGGYIVGPGSVTEQGEYRLLNPGTPPAPADPWVVDRCGRPRPKAANRAPLVALDRDHNVARAVDYLKQAEPAVEGTGGDARTFQVAAAVKDMGIGEANCLALMLAHWNERCAPPWDPAELAVKVGNAYRYGSEPPGVDTAEADFGPGGWPDPVSLPHGLLPVMAFDGDLLPDSLRPYVMDVAERMQCPPDFIAVAVMVALATLVGRRCGIRPKRHDDWLVIANLWAAVVGRPSLMKTPAIASGMRPLDRLIARAMEQFKAEMTAYLVAVELFAGRKKAWQDELRKAGKEGNNADHLLQDVPQPPPEPVEVRYRTNSGSTECLISLLNQNPNGLLLFRDELAGWLKNLERSGREGDRQFYLEAWNGSGTSFDYDTFAHGHLHCESLCLSVLGSIQPGPLSHMIAAAAKGGGGDDGMVQRFQLFVYPDVSGRWKNVDQWPDTEARRRLNALFDRLEQMVFPSPEGGEDIPALRFTMGAQELFDDWREDLETRIRCESDAMLEAHLAKYRSLMPSLALLFHLAETAANDRGLEPVSVDAAAQAAAWCEYLESHARRIYGMRALAEVDGAQGLLRHLKAGDVTGLHRADGAAQGVGPPLHPGRGRRGPGDPGRTPLDRPGAGEA